MYSVKMTHIRPIFGLKTAKTSQRDNDFSQNDTIIFSGQISFLRREPQIFHFAASKGKGKPRRNGDAISRADGKKDLRKQKERGREGENFLGSGVFACQKPINNI